MSLPLLRKTTVPVSPVIVPPMVYAVVEQLTWMLVTLPATTVPVPPMTTHVWVSDGCVVTVTSYD